MTVPDDEDGRDKRPGPETIRQIVFYEGVYVAATTQTIDKIPETNRKKYIEYGID